MKLVVLTIALFVALPAVAEGPLKKHHVAVIDAVEDVMQKVGKFGHQAASHAVTNTHDIRKDLVVIQATCDEAAEGVNDLVDVFCSIPFPMDRCCYDDRSPAVGTEFCCDRDEPLGNCDDD